VSFPATAFKTIGVVAHELVHGVDAQPIIWMLLAIAFEKIQQGLAVHVGYCM